MITYKFFLVYGIFLTILSALVGIANKHDNPIFHFFCCQLVGWSILLNAFGINMLFKWMATP